MVSRIRSRDYTFERLQPDEVDHSIDEIVKNAAGGVLSNKTFLQRAITNQDSVTVVCKRTGKLMGIINGLALRDQPVNPQITFIWIKDRESAMRGIAPTLIERFVVEVQKHKPTSTSVVVNLPTFDVDSIALYSMSGFIIEGFIKGQHTGPDMIVMRRNLKEPSKTPVS